MAIVDVAVNLFNYRLPKLFGVVLSHGLVVIHDVTNHLSVESYGVAHPILESNVLIVALREEIILVDGRDGSNVVRLAYSPP